MTELSPALLNEIILLDIVITYRTLFLLRAKVYALPISTSYTCWRYSTLY